MNELKAYEAAYVLGIAEEGLISKIKDKVKSKFSKNKPFNFKSITLEEFNNQYKDEFEYAKTAITQRLKQLAHDPKHKLLAKAYTPINNIYENAHNYIIYKDGKKHECVILDILERDYWKCGNARELFEDSDFGKSSVDIYNEFEKLIGPGTKAPHLSIDDDGDWDTGIVTLILKDFNIEDLNSDSE